MKRLVMGVMLAAAMVGAAAPSLAQGPPLGSPPIDRIATALGLSEEQRATWEAAAQTFRTTTAPLHDQMRTLHDQIESLLSQANPDPTAVGEKMIAMHALREQMKAARETMDNTVASVLTPEQKSKLETLRAARPHGPLPGGPPPLM
jgi:Spy/CpxP family protein refolding chaperone